jgi:hypothetical protein
VAGYDTNHAIPNGERGRYRNRDQHSDATDASRRN